MDTMYKIEMVTNGFDKDDLKVQFDKLKSPHLEYINVANINDIDNVCGTIEEINWVDGRIVATVKSGGQM